MPTQLVAGDEGLRLLGLDQLNQQVPDLVVIVGRCGHCLGRRPFTELHDGSRAR